MLDFCPLALDLRIWFVDQRARRSANLHQSTGLSALLPALCGIVLRAMRQMTGASICAVLVLAWYWLPAFLLLFVGAMRGRAGGLALVVLLHDVHHTGRDLRIGGDFVVCRNGGHGMGS